MLQLTPQMRILVAVEPVDFRNGIDGLVRLCKEALGRDPFQGSVFAFRNRRGTAVKVLYWDGSGLCLFAKKLEAEDTQIFVFTGIGRRTHNQHVGIAEACRMVGISHQSGPRR